MAVLSAQAEATALVAPAPQPPLQQDAAASRKRKTRGCASTMYGHSVWPSGQQHCWCEEPCASACKCMLTT
jgi:hypothetical protein